MDTEAELCTRCGSYAVSYDHEASSCVCQSCGFVPPQQELVDYHDIAEPQQAYAVGAHIAVTSAYAIDGTLSWIMVKIMG